MASTSGSEPADVPFAGVGFNLSSLGFAVSAGFAQRLAPLGIEPRDFALLRSVAASEGEPQHAIGARLRIPASRMVAFIDSLQMRGLLQRRSHPSDRRARTLHLTERGRELLNEAMSVATSFERELCAGLEGDERAELLDLLSRIAQALDVPAGVHGANATASPVAG